MAQIKISHSFAYECYCCRKFFVRPDKHKNMESCSGAPGIVCNFTSKNLVTFEDNFSAKGNLPMAIHFDYETTAPILLITILILNKRKCLSYFMF